MNPVWQAVERTLGKTGDAWDAVVRAVRRTPGCVREAVRSRGQRRVGVIAGVVVLVLYLLSIGDIAVSPSGRWVGAETVRFAADGWFRPRAPYLFEPVLQVHAGGHLAVFVSPINLLLGVVVAALAGANIALAVHGARQAVACRRTAYGRVFGVLPAFLLGFACCVPTFVLVLGASTAAAVLPVLLPLRPFFYPLTLLLLAAGLVWGSARLRQPPAEPAARAASTTRSTAG